MDLKSWLHMVENSTRLKNIVCDRTLPRNEGVDALRKGINAIGLAIDEKTVGRLFDRARLEVR